MILYPAIDLKDGSCVRLLKGEMDQATVFNDNPAAQALAFQDAGCEWLHLVDLNGAFAGVLIVDDRQGGQSCGRIRFQCSQSFLGQSLLRTALGQGSLRTTKEAGVDRAWRYTAGQKGQQPYDYGKRISQMSEHNHTLGPQLSS